jgi:hypothetical protein
MMRDKRISVIMDARISKIEGVNKIESVIFTKNEKNESERNVEFYIRLSLYQVRILKAVSRL